MLVCMNDKPEVPLFECIDLISDTLEILFYTLDRVNLGKRTQLPYDTVTQFPPLAQLQHLEYKTFIYS